MEEPRRNKRQKKSDKIQYDARDETYLVYRLHSKRRLKRYESEAPRASVPATEKGLMRQLTDFMHFIEDLTEVTLDRVQYDLRHPTLATHDTTDDQEDDDDDGDSESFYAQLVKQAQEKLESQQPVVVQPGKKSADEPVNAPLMLEVAWRWHNAVCQRAKPVTGLYAHCIMLSWAAFCKLFFLAVYENEQLYRLIKTHVATRYDYCAQVSREENVVISSATIGDYTVQEVWLSLQQIVPSLYRNAFTSHMKTYLYALFFRYCDLMCTEQRQPRKIFDNPLFVKFGAGLVDDDESDDYSSSDDDDGDSENSRDEAAVESMDADEWEESDEQDDDEQDDYDHYKKALVPLGDFYALRSAYFFEGQLIFLSQLKRVLFSESLSALCQTAPLRVNGGVPLTKSLGDRCKKSLVQMLSALAKHPDLNTFLKEDFRSKLLSLYVYHGEVERFRARWPHASANPSDVLSMLRPGDSQKALATLKLTAQQMLEEPDKYERELVLLTKCATRQWLYRQVADVLPVDAIDACFVMEELVTLDEIDEHVAALMQSSTTEKTDEPHRSQQPLLLRLVGQYYVVRRATSQLYRTTSFAEAYLLWLQILCREGHLRLNQHMHDDVKSCLGHFKVDWIRSAPPTPQLQQPGSKQKNRHHGGRGDASQRRGRGRALSAGL